MNISFDPRNMMPLESFGNFYPNLRITDNWGILHVENGALLSNDWSKVTVSAPTRIDEKVVEGKGWNLELNPGWTVVRKTDGFKLTQN